MICADLATAFRDLAVGASALITARIAFLGLKSWKIKFKGETELKIALDGVILYHQLADKIQQVRFNTSYSSAILNTQAIYSKEDVANTLRHLRDTELRELFQARDNLRDHLVVANAYWKEYGINIPLQDLLVCFNKLVQAIRYILEDKIREKDRVNQKHMKIVYDLSLELPPDDSFSLHMATIVDILDDKYKLIIQNI